MSISFLNKNRQLIEKTLKENNINFFYHFTSVSNIPSIRKHGLCSLYKIVNDDIEAKINANDISIERDKEKGTLNYVHLSFYPNEQMWFCVAKRQLAEESNKTTINNNEVQKYKDDKFVLLKINTNIIHTNGAIICSTNAASKNATFFRDVLEGLQNTDLKNPYSQAEILVPENIPPKYICFEDDYNNGDDFFYDEALADPFGLVYLSDGCYIDSMGNLHWYKNR